MPKVADISIIVSELSAFIVNNIVAEGIPVRKETQLAEIGVDSFSIIEIILFIERKFGVVIPDESLIPENLRSVEALAACTLRHLQQN